jgi:hypothetical protein
MATRRKVSRSKKHGRGTEAPLPAGEIARAAARIGIPPQDLARQRIADAERDKFEAAVGPSLRRASDLLAERVAVASDNHDYDGMHELAAALADVFNARWSLGVLTVKADEGEQASGGAS